MPKSKNLVVIGNPPYNENSNGKDSKTLYDRFIVTILDCLHPDKLSMIVPSRWMVGGKGLGAFRNRMMNDFHFKYCYDYVNSYDIFPGVDISVGVNYFLWDAQYTGQCEFNGKKRFLNEHDIIIRDVNVLPIINRVKTLTTKFMVESVSSSKPYNIRTSEPVTETGVLCFYNQKIGKQFVNPKSVLDKQKNIERWKVIVPIAPIAGQTNFNNSISIFNENNLVILPPSEICSETYIVIKSFSTFEESVNLITYMKTKFFRFMLLSRIDGQNVSRDCYAWVPDQEDYTKVYTDEYLYEKYNLTTDEIAYIESKIKAI